METVLIVGAGLAGSRCAETLRAAGFDGRIVLAGDEPVPPYERPALSKQLLAGERNDVFLRSHDHWEKLDIELLLGVHVHSLDLRRRTAVAGSRLSWDHLVLATGARLRRPGGLRTLADALSLRERLVRGTRLAIVGGGFVGTEVASTALALGVDVTLVEAGPAPLAGLLGREVGDLLARRARAHGLNLHTQTTDIPDHDVLLWAVGVEPARELLPDLNVDACGRTQVPRVYACGDVTGTGHWTAAAGQAVAVAWAILGEHRPYDGPPYVWSDQFGLRIQLVGDPTGAAHVELDGNDDEFRARYCDASGLVRATLLANRPEDVAAARRELAAAA
jgi:3-phenylpropionate/trans-cinnamate dioxygenase ferredoxin reductase subunit